MANRNPNWDQIFSGLHSRSAEETRQCGRALAASCETPQVLSLEGPLGAGKTQFVQGLAEGLGLDRSLVSSPTFTLVHEYPGGRMPLVHLDLYRLERADELVNLGFEDYLSSPGLCAIEWGDRFPEALPSSAWRIVFTICGGERRIQAQKNS